MGNDIEKINEGGKEFKTREEILSLALSFMNEYTKSQTDFACEAFSSGFQVRTMTHFPLVSSASETDTNTFPFSSDRINTAITWEESLKEFLSQYRYNGEPLTELEILEFKNLQKKKLRLENVEKFEKSPLFQNRISQFLFGKLVLNLKESTRKKIGSLKKDLKFSL